TVFHERAVLQTEPAIDDGHEVAARRLFDQHGGHVATAAGAPDGRHDDIAPPGYRCEILLAEFELQLSWNDRRLAAPIAQMLRIQSCEQRMIRNAWKDIPQSVFGNAKTEAFFQHLGSLFEEDHLQPVTHACDARRWFAHRQRPPANYEGDPLRT